MNTTRRSFLTGAGAATACVGGLAISSRKLYAQSSGPNIDIINGAANAHAITLGNAYYPYPNGNDIRAAGASLQALLNEWQSSNVDSLLNYSAVTPDMLNTNNLPLQSILQQVQIFQPSFQMSDLLDSFLPFSTVSSSVIGGVIANLQQKGLAPYLQSAINRTNTLATSIDVGYGLVRYKQRRKKPHMERVLLRPFLSTDPGGGGVGYSCQYDSAALFAAGTAFLVIGFMSGGLLPGLVITAAISAPFWGPLAAWGGAAVGVWGLGHAAFCMF